MGDRKNREWVHLSDPASGLTVLAVELFRGLLDQLRELGAGSPIVQLGHERVGLAGDDPAGFDYLARRRVRPAPPQAAKPMGSPSLRRIK
jgi:hypothetical protein